jgi:hypothetical protein
LILVVNRFSKGAVMGLAGKNVQFVDAVVLGVNSPTVKLNNLPTLTISRASADPQPKSISLAGVQCVNFICGLIATLESATLITNTTYLLVNTGSGGVSLSLDNGGTVGGLGNFILKPGAVVELQFDGTNLS